MIINRSPIRNGQGSRIEAISSDRTKSAVAVKLPGTQWRVYGKDGLPDFDTPSQSEAEAELRRRVS